jgi:hypothetical protein
MQQVQVGLFEREGGRFLQRTCSRSGTTSDSLSTSNWQESEKRHDGGSVERAGWWTGWDGMGCMGCMAANAGRASTGCPRVPRPVSKSVTCSHSQSAPGHWNQSMFSSSFWKSTEEVSAQNEPRRFWCKKKCKRINQRCNLMQCGGTAWPPP